MVMQIQKQNVSSCFLKIKIHFHLCPSVAEFSLFLILGLDRTYTRDKMNKIAQYHMTIIISQVEISVLVQWKGRTFENKCRKGNTHMQKYIGYYCI